MVPQWRISPFADYVKQHNCHVIGGAWDKYAEGLLAHRLLSETESGKT